MLAGCEQLDQVRALGFQPIHRFADFRRIAGVFVDLRERGQQSRSRQRAFSDLVAQFSVERRADALHGGEAAHQGPVEIRRGIERRPLRG